MSVQGGKAEGGRGRLKIFLGYAEGVGKSYAMAAAAHQRRAAGVDVVVATRPARGWRASEALLAELDSLPPLPTDQGNGQVVDVEGVRRRRPQLVLVDDLAHVNGTGARHLYRYQDVEELLEAGIDVYTTLNIQNLASLTDVVAQITGVVVRDTVPDWLFEGANEIELVDLPPTELRQRLQDEAHFEPEMAPFFRPGNLTALRELALRRAAQRVDHQMRAYMESQAIPGPWPVSERLLVCVSASPLSERVVRHGRRLASKLDAPWVALYVETPRQLHLSAQARERVRRTLSLAEEMGAQVVSLPGQQVADTILQYARAHNVTKILAGKSPPTRWQPWWHRSLVEALIQQSGPIDVYVVSADQAPAPPPTSREALPVPWSRYGQSALLVVGVSCLSLAARPYIAPTNLVMGYLLVVVLAAVRLGRGPSALAAILSVLAFDVLFVPPYLTLAVADAEYLLTFAALLVVGLVITSLAAEAREQAEAAQRREEHTAMLYTLSRALAGVVTVDSLVTVVAIHLRQALSREPCLLLPDEGQLAGRTGGELDEREWAAARWAFEHGQAAGFGTGTLTTVPVLFLPLRGARGTVGVLGIPAAEAEGILTREQRRLLDAFVSQIGQAVERLALAGQAQQLHLLQEAEKLHRALLSSISHDLRTPLVAVTGALSSLRDDGALLDGRTRADLVDNAWEEAARLNRLVGNLLDMSRMEAGPLHLNRHPCDMQDLVGVALEQVASRLQGRPLVVDVSPALPWLSLDFVLMVQVIVNLLDNALKYSPAGSPIELVAAAVPQGVQLSVMDRGGGIPADQRERVFEKFYRVVQREDASGSGLGLSIVRGIVEAHRGTIRAEGRPGGGDPHGSDTLW